MTTGQIIFGLAGLAVTCILFYLNKRNQNLYARNQNDNRPELRVTSSQVFQYKLTNEGDQIAEDGVFEFLIKLEVSVRYTIRNVGKSKASLYGQVYGEVPSGKALIKTLIKDNPEMLDLRQLEDGYYEDVDINPDEEIQFERKFQVEHIDENKFTTHAFLIYANSDDQFFDSYYHARFEMQGVKEDTLDIDEYAERSGKLLDNEDGFITQYDSNHSSCKYSEGEKNRIIKYFHGLLDEEDRKKHPFIPLSE